MKTIFKVICIFSLLLSNSQAEKKSAKDSAGFIRLVNAVAAGTGPVRLEIDGEDMRPKGYDLGDATGGIGLSSGSRKVSIKRNGVEEGVTTVNLLKDQTVTLIPFAEKVPASDTKPAHYVIKILRLKQTTPDSGRTATFVSVSANPELKVEIAGEGSKWESAFVKRLTLSQLPLSLTGGYAPVKVNNERLESIPIDGEGNYVIVIYDDSEGRIQSLCFSDLKFLSAD